MRSRAVLVVIIFLAVFGSGSGIAVSAFQESTPIQIRLNRDMGFGLGGQIQGKFSIKVDGPEALDRVEFYIDDQLIGEDSSSPYGLVFNTGDYLSGVHQISVIGYTTDNQELASNRISRQFVSVQLVVLVVGVVIALVIGARLASHYMTQRKGAGTGTSVGFLGGTICSNCGRSFGIHWWSLRLGFGRLDRCPHCHKWSMVSRVSAQDIAAAQDREDQSGTIETDSEEEQLKEEELIRRKIEESRYSDK